MPVSLGEWRVRIGTFTHRRKKEYDYNYFWSKLVNLIKRAKNVQSPEENNSECNTSQTRSQCDSPECDAVKESGSSSEVKGPGPADDVSHPESSCAENSGSPTANETNPVRDTTDVQDPDPRPCTVDTVDDRDIAINLMSPKYPPKSCQISKTDQPEVGTSEPYSHVPAAVPGEPDRIELHREETSNSAKSGIEEQSLDFSPKPGQDTTINTEQTTPSIKKETEYHGSPTYPVLGSGTTLGEAYGIKGNDCPDMTNILLLRSGDVEQNPGPNDNLTERELNLVADGMDSSDFRKVGQVLGFTEAQLNQFEEGKMGYSMLYEWRKTVRESEAREILVNKLESIKLVQLADRIRKDFDDILKGIAEALHRNSDIHALGKALGFGYADICRKIEENAKQGVNYMGTLDLLKIWQNRQTSSTEKAALRSALVKAQLDNLADQYLSISVPESAKFTVQQTEDCSKNRGQVGDHIPPMTEEEIQRVAEEVKRYYAINLCQIQANPLNNELLLDFERIFTNLMLMKEDKGTKRKTPLLYDDLLKTKVNGIYPKRLLVEGEGGVGKTTFCAKIAWDWIDGKGYQDFKLVLVILFREAKEKTVGEIVKTYLSDNNPVTAKQLDKHILSNSDEVFLVLDGLDESAVNLSSNQQIALITFNRLFNSGTVLITSRQWRSDEIRKNADLRKVYAFIAVEGFSAENLSSYITKFFHPDTASSEDLNQFISNNDVILENMAPYPIYTAMLCIMWKDYDGERREAMSKLQTFSQLFDEMVDFLVDHYLSKPIPSGIGEDKLKENLSDIPHHLLQIGHITFNGLLERQLVFTEDEFQSCPESIDVGCKVGVLTKEKRIPSRRDKRKNQNSVAKSVQFPHKLFQEYLSGIYLASLHNLNHNEYGRLILDIIKRAGEYRYLLYFTSAQQKEVGLDIVSRLIALTRQGSDDGFIVDVAYESQDQAVAKAVADHLSSKYGKELKITEEMQAHTVSGHIFIMNHREADDLIIEKSCGRTASEDLAEFICSSRSLKSVTIDGTMHDVFYSVLANKAVNSKIEILNIKYLGMSERPSPSHDLAQFICKAPHLTNLTLGGGRYIQVVSLHNDFYSSFTSVASSAKIETLDICYLNLSERPSASRDLAQFICKMPHLKSLTLGRGYEFFLHDDFYSSSSLMASSAKIETLIIWSLDLSQRPSASRDLAQFICKMPHMKILTLGEVDQALLHDEFYSSASSMASFAKIETLNIKYGVLSERPCASRDLAQFICKMTHLKDLSLHGQYHDDFYSTASSMASSAKIETLDINCLGMSERPCPSHDLAQFIFKMTHLKNLTLYGQYHDDFYSASSSMASSAKIETLDVNYLGIIERPSASRDLTQFIYKMPHLKNLTLCGQFHDDFYSTSSSIASSAKSGNTSHTLTELTVYEETLRGWQDCGSMFDNVKGVTIRVGSTINYDVIQRIHLPGATELTIQTDESVIRPAGFHEEPTSLPNALLNISPQLVKVTFSDLVIGNRKMELILQAFRSTLDLKHLKIIRFIRCGTEESVNDVTIACNKDQVMEVEVVHGIPRGKEFVAAFCMMSQYSI